MHEYKVNIIKIVDGDTVDVDIDLGFGMWLKNERVRIMGIDTPESRTSDAVEKVFGMLAKNRLSSLLGAESVLRTQVSKKGEDMKGKFGRILGNFIVDYQGSQESCAHILMREHHAVGYTGGSKEETQAQHLANRKSLLKENKDGPGGANWKQFGSSLTEAIAFVTGTSLRPTFEEDALTKHQGKSDTGEFLTKPIKNVEEVDANDSPIVKPEPVVKSAPVKKKKKTVKKK